MKTLEKNEWIAVVVAVIVVGFSLVLGRNVLSVFDAQPASAVVQQPQISIKDTAVGTGDVAELGDSVVVNYVGHLADGTVFDSSDSHGEPYPFVLGSGKVIEGWNQGIAGMRVGGKRLILVPPELAYGPNDYGSIPGGSTVVFEIELLKVTKAGQATN